MDAIIEVAPRMGMGGWTEENLSGRIVGLMLTEVLGRVC